MTHGKPFEYSNIIYSKDVILSFCLCFLEWETKDILLLFRLSAIWTNTFGNWDKDILKFKIINFGQMHHYFCLCEWETNEIVSINMSCDIF